MLGLKFNHVSKRGPSNHPGDYQVDPCTSSWSPKRHGHVPVMNSPIWSTSIGPPIPEIRLLQNLTMKIQGQGYDQGQTQ